VWGKGVKKKKSKEEKGAIRMGGQREFLLPGPFSRWICRKPGGREKKPSEKKKKKKKRDALSAPASDLVIV